MVDPAIGRRPGPGTAGSRPTRTATVSSAGTTDPGGGSAGSAMTVWSAPVSSRARAAINRSAATVSVPPSSSAVTSAMASTRACRSRAAAYRRALWMAIPAAAARAWTMISSSAVNGSSPGLPDR